MTRTASLTAGLVAKKGEAAPASIQDPAAKNAAARPAVTDPVAAGGQDYYKALTVKLDRERYETLKNAGIRLDKKSQEIFVAALDMWLKQQSAAETA